MGPIVSNSRELAIAIKIPTNSLGLHLKADYVSEAKSSDGSLYFIFDMGIYNDCNFSPTENSNILLIFLR